MTTYNTGNPIGSTDARDLYDNAQNLDNFANGSAASYTDRLGVSRRSLSGIDSAADNVLNSIGYAVPVAYASGISLTLTSQTVDYNGVIYAPKSSALPFTTSSWGTDSAKFRAIQVTDADLITYNPAGTGAVATTVQSKLRETVSVADFGAVGDGSTNDTAAIQDAIDFLISRGGGTLYFPDTTSFYKVTSTLNIQATVDSFTLAGDGIWNSEVKMVTDAADTLFTTAGNVYVKDMAITAMPSSGNVYRANDIAFDSSGTIFMQSVALYGWDKGIKWSGGYYYKFFGCDFRFMNVVLSGFNANNVMVDKCKISQINRFALISSGAGPFVVSQCAMESWTQTLVGTDSGAAPQIILRDNYIENYPGTAVATGLVGSYYNNGFVVVCGGDIVLDSNLISCKGIRRIVDTSGSARTVKSRNNRILYQAATATTDYLYNVGTVQSLYVDDHASGELPAGTGSYSTVAWPSFTAIYPESCKVINPISLLNETPEPAWQTLTLSNGWANQDATSYNVASYKKVGKRVYLRGYISGASATAATIATLPAGYRPTSKVYTGLTSSTVTGVAVNMRVSNTGSIIMDNTPYTIGSVFLDGAFFDVS